MLIKQAPPAKSKTATTLDEAEAWQAIHGVKEIVFIPKPKRNPAMRKLMRAGRGEMLNATKAYFMENNELSLGDVIAEKRQTVKDNCERLVKLDYLERLTGFRGSISIVAGYRRTDKQFLIEPKK